jgi:hypothetical protein
MTVSVLAFAGVWSVRASIIRRSSELVVRGEGATLEDAERACDAEWIAIQRDSASQRRHAGLTEVP